MSYLGSSAAPLPVAFAGVNGQSFNGGTNTFTLSRSVSKTTDIELVVNNVQQNPYDGSYSVSGNVLTTAESVSAGVANVYVQYLDAPIGSFAPIDGSVTPAKLSTGAPTWDVNGNLSAGVVPSTWWANGKQFQLGGTSAIWDYTASNNNQTRLYSNLYLDSTGTTRYLNTDQGSFYGQYNGVHTFNSAPYGTAGTTATVTQVLGVSKGTTLTLEGGNSTNGTGISFPAAQNPSSDANTLDDYEEGTWTPFVQGSTAAGSATYSAQAGTYTKVGRVVTLCYDFIMTSGLSGATGNLQMGGFPFASAGGSYLSVGAGAVGYWAGLTLSVSGLFTYLDPSKTFINFVYGGSSGVQYPGVAAVQNGTRISGVIQYETT